MQLFSFIKAWIKGTYYLRNHLHPKSNHIEMKESVYKQLATDPQQVFEIIRDLILQWRKANPTIESS
jgi:hypothetical protein